MTHRRPLPSRTACTIAGAVVLGLAASAPAQAADWRFDVYGSKASTFSDGSRATPRIVGGTALPDSTQAPYTVALQTEFSGGATGGCSGTVVDPVHIVTAAHCVVSEQGERATPPQVAVVAGASDVTTPAGIATGQSRSVGAVRVHPRYSAGEVFDDAAVLTLTAPLDFTTGRVAPLPMAPSGTLVSPGRAVRISGFGITGASANDFGQLRTVDVNAAIGGVACSNSAPGAFICTQGRDKGACSGDSGGTATIGGATARRLIGITGLADANCRGLNFFASVAAPEIRTFIDAAIAETDVTAAQTPVAPRGGSSVRVTGVPRVGRTIKCARGKWTKGTKFRYAFLLDRGTRQRNRGFRTRTTYKLRAEDRGWRVFCAVEVRNAGGQGISVARNSGLVAARR